MLGKIFRGLFKSGENKWINILSRKYNHGILREIIDASFDYVYIQCSELKPDVYDKELQESFKKAIERGVDVRVLVRKQARNVDLYLYLKENHCIHQNRECSEHDFVAVDGKIFEYATSNMKDYGAATNAPKETKNLQRQFLAGWSKAEFSSFGL